jgi:hypothetical protein
VVRKTSNNARANRLLRFYPQSWRARYGDEFAELLCDTLSDDPRTLRMTFDVARVGLSTRLQLLGFIGKATSARTRTRAGMVTMVGFAATFFLAAHVLAHYAEGQRLGDIFGIFGGAGGGLSTVPSQVWQDARHPGHPLLTSPSNYFVLAMTVLFVSVVAAAIPLIVAWIRSLRSARRGPILRPVLLLIGSVAAYEGARLMRMLGHSYSIRGQVNTRFPILGPQSLGVRIGLLGLETARVLADAAAVIAAVTAMVIVIRALDLGPRTVRFEILVATSISVSLIGLAAVTLWTSLWVLPFGLHSFFFASSGVGGTPMWATFSATCLVMGACSLGAIAGAARMLQAAQR